MDLMKGIRERRSVRKFTADLVEESHIQTLLEAVRWAPSWANTQVWEVIVIRDEEVKKRLSLLLERNPAQKAMVAAPVVMALAAKRGSSGYYKDKVTTDKGDWFMFDLGIACQSLCLAAHDQGLGTVVAGMFDHDKAAEVVGLPQGYEVAVMIPLGYPAKPASAPKRRPVDEFTHWEKF